MSATDEILAQLPIDQLAEQVGASPEEVTRAANAVLPALLGGLGANASDPAGAASIVDALGQHDDDLLEGGVDLDQVNTSDGETIGRHIFGTNQDAIVSQLGGVSSTESSLVSKLIPVLAPLVLSWLAKRVLGGSAGAASGGGLQDVLGQVLGGAGGAKSGPQGAGNVITDILGGLLGGGRR